MTKGPQKQPVPTSRGKSPVAQPVNVAGKPGHGKLPVKTGGAQPMTQRRNVTLGGKARGFGK